MRIRRPRLHPPASKSKAFAKVVTFHRGRRGKDRENARNEEQTDRRAGREEREREIPKRRKGERRNEREKEEERSGMGRYANVSLRESRKERRDCCVET